jgi:hypothetical protein
VKGIETAIASADASVVSGIHAPDAERALVDVFQGVRALFNILPSRHNVLWRRVTDAQALSDAWTALRAASAANDPAAAAQALRPLLGKTEAPSAHRLPLSAEDIVLVNLGRWLMGRGVELRRHSYGTAQSDGILCELTKAPALRSLNGWWTEVRPIGAATEPADAISAAERRQRARLEITASLRSPARERVRAALAFDEAEWPDATEKTQRARVQRSLDPVRHWKAFQALLDKDPIAGRCKSGMTPPCHRLQRGRRSNSPGLGRA